MWFFIFFSNYENVENDPVRIDSLIISYNYKLGKTKNIMNNGQSANITTNAEFMSPQKLLKIFISPNEIISGNSPYTYLHN